MSELKLIETIDFLRNQLQTWFENKTLVYTTFENPEVEYRNSYVSYDLLSMVGEIGGLLGLTLGASALTFFEYLLRSLELL